MVQIKKPLVVDADPNKIVAEMVAKYERDTQRKLTDADVDLMLIHLFAYRESLVLEKIQYTFDQNLVSYASGLALDALGEQKEIFRLEKKSAGVVMLFSLPTALTFSVIIPLGTSVKTPATNLIFKTASALIIPAGQIFGDVRAICTAAGDIGNGAEIGSINVLTEPVSFVDGVQNTTVSDGGAEREKDDHLRLRILAAAGKISTAGPKEAYRYFALSAHSDNIDAYVVSPNPCYIDVYLLTRSGKPSDKIIALTLAALSSDDVRPLGDRVCVLPAEPVEYSIELTTYISADQSPEIIQFEGESRLTALTTM